MSPVCIMEFLLATDSSQTFPGKMARHLSSQNFSKPGVNADQTRHGEFR